ncbi:MAG: tetratricopeptide repeat protein [Cellvibrionaceae bacterium]|nr:tetratricopeptide repeat protein [Cellvibrionaceae bacterium]
MAITLITPLWLGSSLKKAACFFQQVVSLALVSVSIALPLSSFAEKPLRSVADLRYGVSLYEYYQGNHFDALSELMVAKVRGGVQGHGDNPDIIEGGINLAFGMERTANAFFSRLLSEKKPAEVRNAAWFYLAKLQYQRGEYAAARTTFDNISGTIPPSLSDELRALDIQLLIRQQDYAKASQSLEAFPVRRGKNDGMRFWRPYLNYNLASAYVRREQYAPAQELFTRVASERLSVDSDFLEEQLVMYDKAYTAAGYGYFQQEDYEAARKQFASVRQYSPVANDALLGFGWSAARLGDYQQALTPWALLSQRPLADDAVQEALLAIPYVYLQMGNSVEAINRYQWAEAAYLEEIARIDETGNRILNQSLADMLDLANDSTHYNWLLPEKNSLVQPHIRYLLPLFSLNRFQNSVQSVRDLYRIQQRLQHWQASLDAYADLLNYRLRKFRSPEAQADSQDKAEQLLAISAQRDTVSQILTAAKQQQNVFLLLDEDRQDLLDFVVSGEKNAQLLASAGEAVDEQSRWLARYRGMLLWSATLDFDERLWQVEADLKAINHSVQLSRQAGDQVKRLLTEAPDIDAAQQRINDYSARIENLLNDNGRVMAQLEENLRQQIFVELAQQRRRIQFYLAEARLAVAQIYDNLYLEQQQ